MRNFIISILSLFLCSGSLWAQADKKELRKGNFDFKKENYKEAEIHYRKALIQDSTSVPSTYNLANTLYQQKDYEGASNTCAKVIEQVEAMANQEGATDAKQQSLAADFYFNKGNISLQKKDWATAVEDFKNCLKLSPSDLEAKQSYIYAKKKLEQQQQNQQGDGEQNQENQQNDQSQNDQKQNQPEQQNGQDQQQPQQTPSQGQQQITPSQAQQMLKAIQAKEKETQEKVEKKQAEKQKSRQKEKNW